MTKPEKDEVLNTSAPTNASGGAPFPSSFGVAANDDTRVVEEPKGSSSGGAAQRGSSNESVTPEVIGGEGTTDPSSENSPQMSSDESVAKAEAETQEWKEKFVRLHAEWDTYRRRTAEQRKEEKAQATEKLVEHLLPVIDDFERTIDYAKKNGEKGLLGGVEAVHTKLIDALKKEGVEVLDPKGEAFHALECQAINTCENKTVPDETVEEVYQKGYKMGKKVLRPAMVTVATGGPKRQVAQDAEQR